MVEGMTPPHTPLAGEVSDVAASASSDAAAGDKPAVAKKPDEFTQAKLKDMKAATWKPRPIASPATSASEMAKMLAAMGWTVAEPTGMKATAPTAQPVNAAGLAEEAPATPAALAAEVVKAAPAVKAGPGAPLAEKAAPVAPPAQPKALPAQVAKAAPAAPVAEKAAPAAAAPPAQPKAQAAEVGKAAPTVKAAPAAPVAEAPPAQPGAAQQVVKAAPTQLAAHTAPLAEVVKAAPAAPTQPSHAPQSVVPLTADALKQLQMQKQEGNAAGLHVVRPQGEQKEYTRRAAANLIKRLRENPSRMQEMPSLHKMVFDESKKSELISMLVDSDGAFEKVGASLQAFEESSRGEYNRKKALRWTKKEMEDHYGADAERTMKFKREQGLVEDDENCPGGELFLVSRREDESENVWRGGVLATDVLCFPYSPRWALACKCF